MYYLYLKEIKQFFYSLTGISSLTIFIIVSGMIMFFLKDTNVFEYGYATMEVFFQNIPYLYIIFIPAVCMKTISDEMKTGTMEILFTKPISIKKIVVAKFFSVGTIAMLMFIPTIFYIYTLQNLSAENISLDYSSFISSYIGLFLLILSFTSISILCSALTTNSLSALLLGIFTCYVFFLGFSQIAELVSFVGGMDYFFEQISMEQHYEGLSLGMLDAWDISYFITIIIAFLNITIYILKRKHI